MNKKEKYERLVVKAKSVLLAQDNILSRYANTCALIKEEFDWLWVGFYLVDEKKTHLYLGPFQGPLACTYIPFNKGVCGKAYSTAMTQVVQNVDDFPDHISCNSASRSEIVVPILQENGDILAVLDIDSEHISSFDEVDKSFLEQLIPLIIQ